MKRSLGRNEYAHFLKGYETYADSKAVLERLKEVEMRGRYVVRKMAE